ncbi:HutD/Ves family protein [Paraburkholderia hayleyella]|uniref:HutD/Ves family protein n=1 Tax=Paraburkholderia hayleyella TaxID=2152889 RepID=UPI001FE83B8B|nr:HutD family protein [Paraburkholderia hayleyella]
MTSWLNPDEKQKASRAASATVARSMLIPAASLIAARWKNGGGITHEIAVHPPAANMDSFDWRVSVADVMQGGPFSRFDGVDRTLVLLAGEGMQLDLATGERHVLTEPLACARFPGEADVAARLIQGPTRDFNLMLRRAAVTGSLTLWSADEAESGQSGASTRTFTADVVLLYCAAGPLELKVGDAPPVTLTPGDTLRLDAACLLPCTMVPGRVPGRVPGPHAPASGVLLATTIQYHKAVT